MSAGAQLQWLIVWLPTEQSTKKRIWNLLQHGISCREERVGPLLPILHRPRSVAQDELWLANDHSQSFLQIRVKRRIQGEGVSN